MSDVARLAAQILRRYPLCSWCLGRLFARLGKFVENYRRGISLKYVVFLDAHRRAMNGDEDAIEDLVALARSGFRPALRLVRSMGRSVEPEKCYVCGGLSRGVEELSDIAIRSLEESGVVFRTFEVGTKLPADVVERESEIVKVFGIDTAETIKHEFNRRIGRIIVRRRGFRVDKVRPDVVVEVDVVNRTATVRRNPIYVLTRYVKLSRAVSQAQRIPGVVTTMVQLLDPVKREVGGREVIIHAEGREDVDARMLGAGRPVVIQIREPQRYIFNPKQLMDAASNELVRFLGGVEASKSDVRRIKSAKDNKVYRALVLFGRDVSEEEIANATKLFNNAVITQYTPSRIKRRPSSKKWRRMVYEMSAILVTPRLAEVFIRCQSGLYVKELLNGDGGRTRPSLAEVLNTDVEVLELDVLDVESMELLG